MREVCSEDCADYKWRSAECCCYKIRSLRLHVIYYRMIEFNERQSGCDSIRLEKLRTFKNYLDGAWHIEWVLWRILRF